MVAIQFMPAVRYDKSCSSSIWPCSNWFTVDELRLDRMNLLVYALDSGELSRHAWNVVAAPAVISRTCARIKRACELIIRWNFCSRPCAILCKDSRESGREINLSVHGMSYLYKNYLEIYCLIIRLQSKTAINIRINNLTSKILINTPLRLNTP